MREASRLIQALRGEKASRFRDAAYLMNRETADSSTAESGEGTTEPGMVRPIADMEDNQASAAGFEFTGGEYGSDSWIVCDLDDLVTITM